MNQYYTGTLLASPIVRGSSGDTYGTHHSVLGVGGYMEVKTMAELFAIPPAGSSAAINPANNFTLNFDQISTGQRRLGMLVHVYENNNIYHLQPPVPYSIWSGYTVTQKLSDLGNNAYWNIFLTSGGTSSSGEKIFKNFIQVTHGFVVGDVIGFDGVAGNYVKLTTTTATLIEPLGIVNKVVDLNTFELTYAGYINTSTILDYSGGTLTAGQVYYLAAVAGKLSKYPPTGLNAVSKPMLVALNTGTTGVVLQYRGTTQTQQGVTLSQFNTYTGNTQTFLNKTVTGATNIGYFSGKTGVQTINVLTSNVNYNGLYSSLNNYYYRDSNSKIQIGSPTYNGLLRRGYVSNFTPKKSWLYNVYTGSSNQIGWILVDGDISTNVGNVLTAGNTSANAGTPVFGQIEFSYTGGTLNDGYYSNSSVSLDVNGSFYTGTTYNIGGPIYNNKQYQELRLRTIVSNSPTTVKVTYDSNFVYISGGTLTGVTNGVNIGGGAGVFSSKLNNCLQFRSIQGSGNTSVSQVGNSVVIYSSGGGGSGTLTGATNGLHLINSGKTISLGGTLISNTCIDSSTYSIALGSVSSGSFILGCGSNGSIYCGSSGTGIRYSGVSGSWISSQPKALVTTEWSTGYTQSSISTKANTINVYCQPVKAIYSANTQSDFIGAQSGSTIYLPVVPKACQRIIVADVSGHASSCNIIICGNINCSSYANINTDWGSVTMVNNGNFWSTIAFIN